MKKLLFSIFTLCFFVGAVNAQDGKKLLKEAEKVFANFIKDPTNIGALNQAEALLADAFSDATTAGAAESWLKKAALYDKLADNQMTARLLNPEAQIGEPLAAYKAYEAFMKAGEIATKKGDIKKAISGIEAAETGLNNYAVELYRAKDYEGAFKNFNASLKANEYLKANDKDSRLDDPILMNDQLLFTGVTAYYSKNYDDAKVLYTKLAETGTDEPSVYEGLYDLYKDDDNAKAIEYLSAGREKFPDHSGLLFAEINNYLQKGELDILIEKLELAHQKEPENMSVLNTLGNVYDKLHVKATKDGDKEKEEQYFNDALKYYNQVLGADGTNFDATYSAGALYYNRAANLAPAINELGNDFSKEGMKKYDMMKKQMDDYFGMALPFFEKAESIDAADKNTLIALKEIFARQNKLDLVDQYSAKLAALDAGGE